MFHGHLQSSFRTGFTPLWFLIVIGVIVGMISFLFKRTKSKSAGLSENQLAILENLEAQILSLLAQHGGGMTQIEIRNSLDLPNDIVAEELLEMERQGMIDRKWLTTDYTYQVSKT